MGEGGPNREPAGGLPRIRRLTPARPRRYVKIQAKARLNLPADLAKKLGASPGARLEVRERDGRLQVRPNIHSLVAPLC